MKKKKDFAVEGLKASPAIVGILTMNPVGIVAGILSLSAQAVEYIKSNIKDLTEEYNKNYELPKIIDESLTSKHHIQFLREWILKVGYETRVEKRKRFLNIAMNYPKKDFTFDEKLLFLNLLDRLSEDELIVFLHQYSGNIYPADNLQEYMHVITMEKLLVNHGLLEIDESATEEAFEKIEGDIKQLKEFVKNITDESESTPRKLSSIKSYNHYRDKSNISYKQTGFGENFFKFIQRETKNETKGQT